MRIEKILLFIRLTRPIFLLGVALIYALGVGIAHYLGASIDWRIYILGQVWVTLLQLSTQYLNEFYNTPGDQENKNRTYLTGGSGALGKDKLPRRVALLAALSCLAFLASSTVLIISIGSFSPLIYIIMILAFIGSFFYSSPPLKLEASGYGELIATIIVALMVPSFAFILQSGELNRLVAMTIFPLAALHMSMLLAFELPDYASDLKFEKFTLMVRIGWQNGMKLHNTLILSAFLLIIVALYFGMPRKVALSALITIPLGIFQIWQMRRIAMGGRPNWNSLTIIALALFALTTYFMTFTYWIN